MRGDEEAIRPPVALAGEVRMTRRDFLPWRLLVMLPM